MSPYDRLNGRERCTVGISFKYFISLTLICLLCGVAFNGKAQSGPYQFALGLRAGITSGVCAKYFIKDDIAAEGIAGIYFTQGTGMTLLLEKHWAGIADVDGLFFYAGLGGHLGVWNYYYSKSRYGDLYAGIDAIAGLEYSLEPYNLPLTVSLDVKPKLDVFNYYGGYFFGTGASVRYIIK